MCEQNKSDKVVSYEHHGVKVFVRERLKGTHRQNCLCFSCCLFNPEDRENNCKMANLLFAFCQAFGMTTPVFECPNFA